MSTETMYASAQRRWNPWPTAIISYFIVFATLFTIFIVYAARQPNDVVSQDYYGDEVRFQQRINESSRALALGGDVAITLEKAPAAIAVKLPPSASLSLGRIHLYRPADAKLDREVPLAMNNEGLQKVDATGLKDGLWKVRVEWSAAGEDYSFEKPVVIGAKPK